MNYTIERIQLTDDNGVCAWGDPTFLHCCHLDSASGAGAVSAAVAADGAEQLSVTASFAGDQTIAIARKGRMMYALRARPTRNPPERSA